MSSPVWGLPEVVAAGCGPVVKLWAPADPKHAIKLNEGTPVYCLDFSHNNRVLTVAGEKGQAILYSGKGASVATGAANVGNVPRAPDAGADSITCIKFAPNDSYLLGGCRNGLVHIWSLKEEVSSGVGVARGRADALYWQPCCAVPAAAAFCL